MQCHATQGGKVWLDADTFAKHMAMVSDQFTYLLGVCVFLASGYNWVTVMHEIPISSAQTMTSFHTLELSSTNSKCPKSA